MLCAFVADRRRPVQPSPDIRALDSLGCDVIERAYADSTRQNLNSHIKIYLTFCEAVSSTPFPMTVKLITRYIAYLVSLGRVYGTILNHLSSIKHMHKFLGQRYVDDTFTIMPDIASAEIFLDTLNHCHPSAKFTMEVERNTSLPFIGVELLIIAPRIKTKVYVKPIRAFYSTTRANG